MRQLATVTAVRLDSISLLMRNQTWLGDDTLCAIVSEPVVQPVTKVSGFIDDFEAVTAIRLKRAFESFPDPRLSGLLPREAAPQIPLISSGSASGGGG